MYQEFFGRILRGFAQANSNYVGVTVHTVAPAKAQRREVLTGMAFPLGRFVVVFVSAKSMLITVSLAAFDSLLEVTSE